MKQEEKKGSLMEKIVSLAKRRGFVFPGSEIYGGLANSWDYGPLGVELKNNIKKLWWERFVHRRDDVVGLDAALIMNPKVWEASGHLKEFSDPLVECKQCHERFRVNDSWSDEVWWELARALENAKKAEHETIVQDTLRACPSCGARGTFTIPRQFNLMFKTFIGPAEENTNVAYFRPETAQAMFVDFKQILDTARKTLPFGVAQIGKAFRNEITPGNFIFRTREFEQMEIEYFIRGEEWEKWFDYWLSQMKGWLRDDLGISENNLEFVEIPDGERAHYSKRTIDVEYKYPFGQKELYGLAYRTDFDLKNHFKEPPYRDSETNEAFYPHVIEPTWGVDRSVLVTLLDGYTEEQTANGKEQRVYLKLKPRLAPYKAAVFPLLANKPHLTELARTVYQDLRKEFMVDWDDRGNIGKRYYAQDEIGTPFCITVDFDSLEHDDVTIRDRDTAKQERIKISELKNFIRHAVYR